MSARLTPYPGTTISDPTTATAIAYTTWTGVESSGFLLITNTSETEPVYLVTADDETSSGRSVPPGSCASFGPYGSGEPLWIVGADASPVRYSFDAIASEGR
jgi:hypothetical protein